MTDRVAILQAGHLPGYAEMLLRQRFDLHSSEEVQAAAAQPERGIRGIATTGKAVIGRDLIGRLPDLRIISCLGAGSEGVDTEAARERGVAVATTSHVLAADVADIAMGLIIATARDFIGADRYVRSGRWEAEGRYPLGVTLQGARLGIVGLGTIGGALAQRAAAFGMEIGYHARTERPTCGYRYFADVTALADWCRCLVLCCPGGSATYRLVDARVLRALGTDGFLVNVARGSVVDEAALAAALQSDLIAGAGLDVFDAEPHPHPGLIASPRVTLLPHIGSATHETRLKMAEAMVAALEHALAAGHLQA